MKVWVLVVLLFAAVQKAPAQDVFTVGGLFHDDNYQVEMAFKYAISRHNMFNHDVKFKTNIKRISRSDTFAASKIVCEMVAEEDGIVAIFGPQATPVSWMVQSISSKLEIPNLQTNYKPKTTFETTTVLNMYPEPDLLSMGLATLVKNMDWRTYMIVYETNEGLVRLQDVLKLTDPYSYPVTIHQLEDTDDHRPLLKEVKKSTEFNIILDCEADHLLDILRQANEVEILDLHYSYLITSLDAHTLDFSSIDIRANITTVRLVDPENPMIHNTVRDWELGELNNNQKTTLTTNEVLVESVLMHDAVNYFTQAFRELHITEAITSRGLSCDDTQTWEDGFRITNYMTVRPMQNALTGPVKFNEWGKRVEFNLEIVEILPSKMELIATWSPDNTDVLSFIRSEDDTLQQVVQNLQKTTVIVSSRIGSPYLIKREPQYPGEILEGNARYEGYSLDLIDAISKELNFTYRFELAADGKYGGYDPVKKEWNGLIKDLLDRNAHLAICDLTITHQRREAVDFSIPFMNLGISILYSKSKPSERNIFAFMEPLDGTVWLYILSAFVSMTVMMYLIARMAPGDWENPHPCDQNPEELENVWDMKNCLWILLGSTLLAGCDLLPKGMASRMAISAWWFFILILNSSYTANLAAFLTMDKMAPTITSAEALAKQTKVKYGAVDGGSTLTFFKESNFSTYARMWTQMEQARPSVFEKSNADGVKRVLTTKNQQYAFLMESTGIEYEVERNCDLKQVGNRLDSKSYGIAMPVNSQYRSAINKAVLKMQEDGTLRLLKKRWWKDMHGGGACDSDDSETSSAELKLVNVGGVFLVVGVGVAVALCFSIIEFLWNVHSISVDRHISHHDAFMMEFKFAIQVWITEKRTAPELSETSSKHSREKSVQRKASVDYSSLNGFVDENSTRRPSKKS